VGSVSGGLLVAAGNGRFRFEKFEKLENMAKINPGQFIREVRREVSRVTWPTRKETTVSTGMVFLMVFVAAIFFFLVDQVLSNVVKLILSF
jgi:preprotein translocase subunit SecE